MNRSLMLSLSVLLLIACGATVHAQGPGAAPKQYAGDDTSVDITSGLKVEDVPPPAAVEGPTGQGTVLPPDGKPPRVIPPTVKPTLVLSNPKNDVRVFEGAKMTIRWNSTGDIPRVRLYYYGDRTQLGGHGRGDFGVVIADSVANTGSFSWTIPWVDSSAFRLRVAGLDPSGRKVAADERAMRFLPKEAAEIKEKTFIFITKEHQRLYYVQDGELKRIHIISTALPGYVTPNMRPGSHDPKRGGMGKVWVKEWAPVSREYHVVMRYWLQITQSGSHGIHATSPGLYDQLGGPASHGCVRQHAADAAILYDMVHVGTPVYIM